MEAIKQDFQKYLNPDIRPISKTVADAIESSPFDGEHFLSVEEAQRMTEPGYGPIENGYGFHSDGSVVVSVLTDMPHVTPSMWHWWFGWHGDSSDKYKLWHPPAHVSAEWGDKEIGRVAYIGRDSHIREYLGPSLESGIIQFKDPAAFGLPQFDPDRSDEVFICARIGLGGVPFNFGWLVHQVRKTDIGSEMRSRFWMGGRHIEGRNRLSNLFAPLIRRVRKIPETQIADLTQHCAEEMAHLATFLPDLYADHNG